jgi:hypothetical protein
MVQSFTTGIPLMAITVNHRTGDERLGVTSWRVPNVTYAAPRPPIAGPAKTIHPKKRAGKA